ncbi:MAG: class II SORL domain-containing protein [Chloroflexia bacterium]|nr:class II SORL domain-containing protein [Chloroflexia bacterium]
MGKFGEHLQTADWKSEKHVPVIEAPDEVQAGEPFVVNLMVGKEIAHPNTTEHHIRWIRLYFQPAGGKFSYEIASCEFNAHGEAAKGPNTGPVYTEPQALCKVKLNESGTLYALSFCNIHGLWEAAHDIQVVE